MREYGFRFDRAALYYGTVKLFDTKENEGEETEGENACTGSFSKRRRERASLQILSYVQGIMCGRQAPSFLLPPDRRLQEWAK